MISFPERPKRGRILEIAIVISVAVHLLLGGFATYHSPLLAKLYQKLVPPPKEEKRKMVALSTTITIEKRTKPRPVPRPKPQRVQVPVRPQPHVVRHVAVAPRQEPLPKPTEIARIVQRAKEVQALHPVPKGVALRPQPQAQKKISEKQIEEMQQRFAQTIAMARANNDPTRVPPQNQPSTMKRAKLDIEGIDDLMRRGEGILTPRDWFPANVNGDTRGMCYYVDYQIQFSDGAFDQGPVYWPICYPRKSDPFALGWRGFPLPGPPNGWEPTPAQLSVISAHPLLRLYFPDRFPNEK